MNSPWVVGNGAHNRFWAMGNGGQIFWVTDVDLALQFARRIDAENFAEEDEDAWQIIQVAALQEEQKLPRTNWQLSNRLQEVELMDILRLLAGQEITASKALEAIHTRVAGNEPALPEEQVKISPLEGELTARLVTAFEAKGVKVVPLQKHLTLPELEQVAASYLQRRPSFIYCLITLDDMEENEDTRN